MCGGGEGDGEGEGGGKTIKKISKKEKKMI